MTDSKPIYSVLSLAMLLMVIAGCSTNVVVKGDFPAPLAHPLPLNADLVLTDEFRTYTFTDEKTKGKKLSFTIGEAQAMLFQEITDALFASVTERRALEGNATGELVLVPRVEEIQVARPFETQLKVFEVWIKYNLSVYDEHGQPIADWIMSSYGKTPTRFLTSDEEALNQAAIVALRDAGARLIIEFRRVPEIQAWLRSRAPATAGEEKQPT